MLDIGSQAIAKSLTKDQRRALKNLSVHMKSIKRIVAALGPDSLAEYCRYGYLSEEKISELEGLEPYLPDEESESSHEVTGNGGEIGSEDSDAGTVTD